MESRTWWWIGGGAVVLAIILFFVFSGGDSDETTTTLPEAGDSTTTTSEPAETTTEGDATTTTEGGAVTAVKTCFVTDDAGVDDRSFNASGWAGVLAAVDSGAAQADPILLESASEADYQPHVENCLAQGAEHIVTSGFKLADTTGEFAAANPEVQWTIIDFASLGDNVTGLEFQTDEAAFAAGYVAAGMSTTGVVGTYGGVNIPPVSIFMDGYARGVAHYNEIKGTSVQVLGWDPDDPDSGTMTGTFDPADPAVLAACSTQLDNDADIMLPVGGAINLPCGTEIQSRGIEGALIGVDADAVEAMPAEFADLWLTTILKGIAIQTQRSIEAHASGSPFGGSSFVGNLENGGVGLAPYHSWEDRVPSELAGEVEQLLADIADGTVDWEKFPVGQG